MTVDVNPKWDNSPPQKNNQMLIHLTNNLKMIICILNHCIKGSGGKGVELNERSSWWEDKLCVERAKLHVIPPWGKVTESEFRMDVINSARGFSWKMAHLGFYVFCVNISNRKVTLTDASACLPAFVAETWSNKLLLAALRSKVVPSWSRRCFYFDSKGFKCVLLNTKEDKKRHMSLLLGTWDIPWCLVTSLFPLKQVNTLACQMSLFYVLLVVELSVPGLHNSVRPPWRFSLPFITPVLSGCFARATHTVSAGVTVWPH